MRLWGLMGALLVATSVASQEITTDVYPSEDELAAAVDRGDLSVADYIHLRELLQLGIDSLDGSLWEYIAGVGLLVAHPNDSGLAAEQAEAYRSDPASGHQFHVRHQYSKQSSVDASSRYRSSVEFRRGSWRGEMHLHREYSGAERFRSRWVEYRGTSEGLRRLRLGNFTTTFGLGTVLGYPERRLDMSERIGRESCVYTDYSGYNGSLAEWRLGDVGGRVLLSQQRDSAHAVSIGAAAIETYSDEITAGLLVSQIRVRKRATGRAVTRHRVGGTVAIEDENDRVAAEVSADPNTTGGTGVVIEGRLQRRESSLGLAVWRYGEDFVDLSAGSRAMSMSQSDTLDEIDFVYSSRRAGQTGGMVHIVTMMAPGWRAETAGSIGARARDEFKGELLAGITRYVNGASYVRIDHTTRSISFSMSEVQVRRTSRVEWRSVYSRWWWRSYAAYRTATGERDYLALFSRGGVQLGRHRSMEWWVHLSKIELPTLLLYRWYGYVSLTQTLFEHWRGEVKLSHSYNRTGSSPHVTQVQLDLEMSL